MNIKQICKDITQAELARLISSTKGQEPLTAQSIGKWLEVPPKRVPAVEKITGISRYKLRPDIYGKAPKVLS